MDFGLFCVSFKISKTLLLNTVCTVFTYVTKFLYKYIRQKTHFCLLLKFLIFFDRYVPQNINGRFHSYFQNGYTLVPKAIFAFYCTKLSQYCNPYCKLMLTSNFSTLPNWAPHVPQDVHFKIQCCIDKIHKLPSDKVCHRYD